MIGMRLLLYGSLLLGALLLWSWLKSLRTEWARQNRGALGWILSVFILTFLFLLLKALLPKI
ncbi:MAG: hypothetical protein KY468_11525 [Armatimonadetes bacterium]|nr:hypothetical protein [Armatimonadota bacterium]